MERLDERTGKERLDERTGKKRLDVRTGMERLDESETADDECERGAKSNQLKEVCDSCCVVFRCSSSIEVSPM